jgi:hypothetical protein
MTEENSPEMEWTPTGLFYQPSFWILTTADYGDTAFQWPKGDIPVFIFYFSGVRYARLEFSSSSNRRKTSGKDNIDIGRL